MGSSVIGVAISGLQAAQLGLATTSHNISNVSTPGYTRQEIIQTTNTPQFTGSGYVGQGVNAATVRRVYSGFVEGQLRHTQSQASLYEAHYTALKQIDDLLAEPNVGLSPTLEAFFGAAQDLAARPADAATRQSLISASQTLVARFQDLNSRLDDARTDANQRIGTSVGLINSFGGQIAELNQQIVLASATGVGDQLPNDLLDRRDALIRDLAQEVGVSVVNRSDGSLDVFLGNGQALVLGQQNFDLVTIPNQADPRDLDVAVKTGGTVVKLGNGDLGGGQLAAYFAFRDDTLANVQYGLGRLALALTQTFNEQHRLGLDAAGAMGGDYFQIAQPSAVLVPAQAGGPTLGVTIADVKQLAASEYRLKFDGTNYQLTRLSDNTVSTYASLPQTVDGLTIQLSSGAPAAGDTFHIRTTREAAGSIGLLVRDPTKIAAAAPILASATKANTGTATVSLDAISGPPTDPNLQQPVTITFTSASPLTFDVAGAGTGNPTGVAYTPGAAISYNGWTIKIEGAPAVGDSFVLAPNSNGLGDNRNAAKLAALQTTALVEGGTATLQAGFAQLVSRVGNQTRELRVESEAQANLVELTQQAQQSVSGVNLDEEAAKLIRYQQAYQAAGKLIGVAQSLFEEILGIMR